jgi:hypothetical protein
LLRGLVQAYQRMIGIVGPRVDGQHVFHRGYERAVRLRRDNPALSAMGLEDVCCLSAGLRPLRGAGRGLFHPVGVSWRTRITVILHDFLCEGLSLLNALLGAAQLKQL